MNRCPKCQQTDRQNRAGKTNAGSQRYRCIYCQIKYTPEPKQWVYDEQTRQKALEMYVDGINLRRITRHLGTHIGRSRYGSKRRLPTNPRHLFRRKSKMWKWMSFSLSLERKKQIYILTIVDRATRCFLGFKVVWERTQQVIQDMVDEAVKAKQYHSDAFDAYDRIWYHYGQYEVSECKADTFSVEGDNAELRHYLARLARRSRFFTRCVEALGWAVQLFVFSFNRRQLMKQRFPNYPAHVFQFI